VRHVIVATLVASLVLVRTSVGAQPGARAYDPKTVETLNGEVERVEHVASPRAAHGGVHFVLRTATGTVQVHLGPARYVDAQPLKLAPGDAVVVTGSRVTVDGAPAIVAAKVQKGERVLILRDAAGIPKWRGAGRGAR
jgi:hypothetical protein